MQNSDSDHAQAVALFRYGLIADLLRLEPRSKGLYARIEQKAAAEYTLPGSVRTRVAAETIRDWLKRYRRGGFDALVPKPRADRGQPRSLPPAVVEVLLQIKEGNPKLSVQLVIREARQRPEVPQELPLATLDGAPPARPPWLDGGPAGRAQRGRSPPLRLCPGRRAVDERCPPWAQRIRRRSHQTQDLSDRLHRRCHPGDPLRRL